MSTTQAPAQPELTRYVLYYRFSSEPGGFSIKWFDLKGDLTSAIRRGREHCLTMQLKFLSVRPFMSDLDKEEKERTARES